MASPAPALPPLAVPPAAAPALPAVPLEPPPPAFALPAFALPAYAAPPAFAPPAFAPPIGEPAPPLTELAPAPPAALPPAPGDAPPELVCEGLPAVALGTVGAAVSLPHAEMTFAKLRTKTAEGMCFIIRYRFGGRSARQSRDRCPGQSLSGSRPSRCLPSSGLGTSCRSAFGSADFLQIGRPLCPRAVPAIRWSCALCPTRCRRSHRPRNYRAKCLLPRGYS